MSVKSIVYLIFCVVLIVGLMVNWYSVNGSLQGYMAYLVDEMNPENHTLSLYQPVQWTEEQREKIISFYKETSDGKSILYYEFFQAVFDVYPYFFISTIAFWIIMGIIRLITFFS